MNRLTGYPSFLTPLILPACLFLASNAAAQQESSSFLPSVTPKHAGTYHVATNTWTRGAASATRGWDDVLFDNTCTVGYFGPVASNQRDVEDGRIPSTTSPTNPGPPYTAVSWTGTQDSYQINGFEFSYCTFGPTVDHEFNFWECFTGCQDATLLTPLATFQILGSPGLGTGGLSCWTVSVDLLNIAQPFIMKADCDGTWNGGGPADTFGWSFQQLTPSTLGTGGPMIAGDPAGYLFGGPGGTGCEFGANTAFYTGANPTTEGSGLSGLDQWEVDTMTPPPPVYYICYFYGGYAGGNLYASYYMKVTGESEDFGPGLQYCPGDGIAPHTPCPFNNDNDGSMGGCYWGDPTFPGGGVLDAVGSSSLAANDTYLEAYNVPNDFGLFFGGDTQVHGGNGNPLNDGLRCVGTCIERLHVPTKVTGHSITLGPIQSADVNAYPGHKRNYQFWFRSANGPGGTGSNLSNGYQIFWLP